MPDRCPTCGADTKSNPDHRCATVQITGLSVVAELGKIGTVIASAPDSAVPSVDYSAPSGSRSKSSIENGVFKLDLTPPVDIGKKNEALVVKRVRVRLTDRGHRVD